MKKYVLTGGPSVGKTTVINLLSTRGYKIIPEAARMIIEEEKLKNSEDLPWKNMINFQEKVAARQLKHEEVDYKDGIFLDRSIVDGYAYCVVGKVSPIDIIIKRGFSRYDKIFILEPLPVYEVDDVRYEDKELAALVQEEIRKAYELFSYELISVPVLSPEERVNFIISKITNEK